MLHLGIGNPAANGRVEAVSRTSGENRLRIYRYEIYCREVGSEEEAAIGEWLDVCCM